MTDREKVINGLECCQKATAVDPEFSCEDCPYNEISVCVQDCRSVLCADALELLKEQEPRVLSYEQIKGIVEGVVWLELNGREAVYPWIVLQGKVWRPDYNIGYECWEVCKENEYNRIVRCWSSKPTEEQRRAVKWDAAPRAAEGVNHEP